MKIERPDRLAIVALGPSSNDYIVDVERAGGRHALFDQVWVVNTYAGVLDHDLVLAMDGLRTQERRATAGNVKIANMLAQFRRHAKPILTSTAYPEYPTSEAYPLEMVAGLLDCDYLNNTVAYGIALAIAIGVKELSLYGVDFNWRGCSEVEPGRACVEFWLGRAMQRGIIVRVPPSSTLFDSSGKAGPRHYGYDDVEVKTTVDEQGKPHFTMTPREPPDAAEIERRYDHGKVKGER